MNQHSKIRSLTLRSILLLLAMIVALSVSGLAQDSGASDHARKVAHRVVPSYPELAKKMGITGTVRLMAVVAPNGSVKLVEPMGGHPVLVKSAEDAVLKWKYVPAEEETKESVELHFSPE